MATLTFEELKTKYQSKFTKEDEVNCKILLKLNDGCLVDINEEWEGFIPASHLANQEQSINEVFKALIISGPDKSDRYVVSPKALKEKGVWTRLENLKEENNPTRVTISRAIKGGAEVFMEGLRAFLPGRYIRLPGMSHEKWGGQEIDVLIEELDYKEKKIILNHRKAIDLQRYKQAEITLGKINEGDILDVPVLRIADFGVFVDLGGVDGLIPASELSWGRFDHPREIVKVGQILRTRVFRIEKENKRVALSVKQLLGDPWEEITYQWQVGKQLTGKVIAEANFGLFVELKPGVEALLHNSEIPENKEKPKVGTTITVKIIKMDANQRKIGLSLKDVEQEIEVKEQETQEKTTALQVLPKEEELNIESASLDLNNLSLSAIDETVKDS